MDPDDLEMRIEVAALQLATSPTPEARRLAWERLQALVAQRSAETVEQMERERGLA